MTTSMTIRLVILLLFYSLNQVASNEYYIIANSTDLCTTRCLTLSQFVANSNRDLDSDITLTFSPGIHYLNSNLTISNSDNFTMTSQDLTAEIRCTRHSQVVFNHSLNVDITNLEFFGCGGIQGLRINRYVACNATFRGQEYNGTTLQLIETTAHNIINCTFSSNRNEIFSSFYCYSQQLGGAIIAIHSNIDISESIFENNGATCFFSLIYGGTIIYARQQSNININTSTFIGNSAWRGILFLDSSNATIEQSIFKESIGCTLSLC